MTLLLIIFWTHAAAVDPSQGEGDTDWRGRRQLTRNLWFPKQAVTDNLVQP